MCCQVQQWVDLRLASPTTGALPLLHVGLLAKAGLHGDTEQACRQRLPSNRVRL
jgi:hypothetical protein